MTPISTRSARRARVLTGLLTTVVVVGGLPLRATAQTAEDLGGDIAAKRAEAARIATEIEALGAEASIALEAYRQAQDALGNADAHLFETRRHVEELRRRYESTQADSRARVLAMYRGESTPNPMVLLDARSANELGTRRHYANVVAGRDRATMDRLGVAREALVEDERRLEAEREQVVAQADAVRTQRDEVDAAMGDRQAALGAAQGELNQLVAEEQQRRAAEEEARVREAARRRAEVEAQRRAAEEAARAATSTTSPSTGPAPPSTGSPAPPPSTSAPANPPPPPHPRAGEAVQAGLDKIGTPYQWGGNGPDSYDCSGLTTYAWGSVGVRLPRSSWMQKDALPPVAFDQIQPGDLLFYGSPVHHVGMFIGDGKMVNAPYTGTEVRIDSIYRRDFAGAGRPR